MKRIKGLSSVSKKKGNAIFDTLFLVIALGIFATIFVFANQVSGELTTSLNGTDSDISAEGKAVLNDINTKHASIFDGLFIFGFVVFWIAAIAASFLVDTNPAFFIITVVILILMFFILMLLSNSWVELFEESDISDYAEKFPMTMFIINNLLVFGVAVSFSVVIVLFGKNAIQ